MAQPKRLRQVGGILIGISVGLIAGAGGFTFFYADGAAYLSNNPRACANCHVMHEQFDAWSRSSHHAVATCNDCHTPHTFFGKYFTKAVNGFNHSLAFTVGGFHEPIQVTTRNRRITENACRHCHESIVHAIDHTGDNEPMSCIRCHVSVGHLH
ncbi:MAG: cytochrome c nitrite reductase small subunit [Phycisphaerales bacterium]|nr:cytochrome c nitrite reductase small subunit [Phycisphaerales bacterium]